MMRLPYDLIQVQNQPSFEQNIPVKMKKYSGLIKPAAPLFEMIPVK